VPQQVPAPVAVQPVAERPAADVTPPEPTTAAVEPPAPAVEAKPEPPAPQTPQQESPQPDESTRPRPTKGPKAKGRRSSVPSWDEIMLGSSRQRD
jgi:hypothetical protein